MNKSRRFNFRLSESDYGAIQQKAKEAKLKMAPYILSAALGKSIVHVDGLEKNIAELKAIGKNLNQLTTLCNMGKIQCLSLDELKEDFKRCWQYLLAISERKR